MRYLSATAAGLFTALAAVALLNNAAPRREGLLVCTQCGHSWSSLLQGRYQAAGVRCPKTECGLEKGIVVTTV